MIESYESFINALKRGSTSREAIDYTKRTVIYYEVKRSFQDHQYCPTCLAITEVILRLKNSYYSFTEYPESNSLTIPTLPWVFESLCSRCKNQSIILISNGVSGYEYSCFHTKRDGYVPNNAPDGIKYFIDQAMRARFSGALSASVAMYRSVIECILYDQNYRTGTVLDKIRLIESQLNDKSAPNWAYTIDISTLKMMNHIGNISLHGSSDDESYKNINEKTLQAIDHCIKDLLFVIYERPLIMKNNHLNIKDSIKL